MALAALVLLGRQAGVLADASCAPSSASTSNAYDAAIVTNVQTGNYVQGIDGSMTTPSSYSTPQGDGQLRYLITIVDASGDTCPFSNGICRLDVGEAVGTLSGGSTCNNYVVGTADCYAYSSSLQNYNETEDVNGYFVAYNTDLPLQGLNPYTVYNDNSQSGTTKRYSSAECGTTGCHSTGQAYLPDGAKGAAEAGLLYGAPSNTGATNICTTPSSVEFGAQNGQPLPDHNGDIEISPDGRSWEKGTAPSPWDSTISQTDPYQVDLLQGNNAFIVQYSNDTQSTRQYLGFLAASL